MAFETRGLRAQSETAVQPSQSSKPNTARARLRAQRTDAGTRKVLGNLEQIRLRLGQLRKDDSELVAKLADPGLNGSREPLESQRRLIAARMEKLSEAEGTLRRNPLYVRHQQQNDEWMRLTQYEPWEGGCYPHGY